MAGHMDRRTRGRESIRMWAGHSGPSLPSAPTHTQLCLPWVAVGVAHPPRPLGWDCRADGGSRSRDIYVFWGLSGSLRQTTCISDPTPAREQARGADAQDGAGQQDQTPFCSQARPWSSSVARKAQGKKRRGNEKSVAQVFCVTGGGLGVPGPGPGDFSSLE